jgi:hypothetical protein
VPIADADARAAATEPPDGASARKAAAAWLAALEAGDRKALEQRSAPQLEVIGFWFPAVPERSGCGKQGDGPAELSARVADGLSVSKIVECVVQDVNLMGAIPQFPSSQWPETAAGRDTNGRSGFLKAAESRSLPPRLTRYRKAIAAASAGGRLLSFFVDDGSGDSAYGAIVVRQVGNEARVANVFIDQKFED